jgi:hypothetical protein
MRSRNTVKGMLMMIGPDGEVRASRKTSAKLYPHLSMADLDGDGLLDMHVVQERKNGKIKVHAVDSYGERLRLKSAKVTGGRDRKQGNAQLSFADLDGDGRAEAYSYQRGAASISSEDEFGYFVAHQHKSVSNERAPLMHQLFGSGRPGGIAIGDVDGDGVQELVAGMSGSGCGVHACSSGPSSPVRRGVVIQRLDGSLLPKFPKPLPQRIYSDGDPYDYLSWRWYTDDRRAGTPAISDLDGDGLKEIVWVDSEQNLIFVWNVEGTPGPLVADWPMYHHDPRHSNVLPVSQQAP